MQPIVVDASPLIYLAKLDALGSFAAGGWQPLLTPAVVAETAVPALSYRFPDALVISTAVAAGTLGTIDLTIAERAEAVRIREHIGGLGRGECESLAVAAARGLQVVIHERQGRRVARALGVTPINLVEVLFRGTADQSLFQSRISRFAAMTALRATDLEALIARYERRIDHE